MFENHFIFVTHNTSQIFRFSNFPFIQVLYVHKKTNKTLVIFLKKKISLGSIDRNGEYKVINFASLK